MPARLVGAGEDASKPPEAVDRDVLHAGLTTFPQDHSSWSKLWCTKTI